MSRVLYLSVLVLLLLLPVVSALELDSIDEMHAAELAFEGQEVPQQQPLRRLKSRISSEPADESFAELSSTFDPNAPRVKKQSTRDTSVPLPVSKFGVPSVADEECVMCQYFVQRFQAGTADRLDNGPSAIPPPNDPNSASAAGLPGASMAAQHLLKIRNSNSQLQKKPGGRGIVRVVVEDVLQSLCAVDKMPLLFNPHCSAIEEPNAINAIRKGIFFNIPTAEICQQAYLCRDDSYLNSNAAVHSGKASVFLNSQRGICGMLGGARDRPTSREGQLINAVCAAHGAIFGQDA